MERVLKRQEVPAENTWDLESIYPTNEIWEQDHQKIIEMMPKLTGFQGKLGESAKTLLGALQVRNELSELLYQLVVYASMRRDENAANSTYQALSDRAMSLAARARATGAFMIPEILSIPTDKLYGFLDQEPGLQTYKFELEDLIREKAHVRSPEVEELLAQNSEVTAAAGKIFSTFSNADLKFPKVKDEQGNELELTEGRWPRFRESADRSVRENSFKVFYATYNSYRNTLATSYGSNVRKDVFYAHARKYPTARAMALSGNNIPEAVYDNLVGTVNKHLPILHRYLNLRKRLLNLDQVHMWDLYNPMVAEVEKQIPYAEAVETILKSVAPLGGEYVGMARKGMTEERWVDRYENVGKRSGAYSHGSYTTKPFILMNYADNLDSMYTLTHELGHSMHSWFSRKHQPFHYSGYTIFVAEVASTFNEALLTDYLLKNTQDPKIRMYLINHSLESFRTTLYRQTMFAEFEHMAHQRMEEGQALTADSLCQLYLELNQKYYGTEGVVVDKEIEIEWTRIPHFYGAYYVYQYATGLSAATALSQQVLTGGQSDVERYLGFLKKGGSDYSINILRDAGIDMSSSEPVQQALHVFSRRLDEMEALVG